MNKPKKQGTFVSAYINQDAYDMLAKHCEETGQSKTKAIERAIQKYCTGDKKPVENGDSSEDD